MKNLSSLLERLSKVLNKDTVIKESVTRVIKEKIGIEIPQENINLNKEGVLEIINSPSANNEIRLKEEYIKTELREVYNISISRIFFK
jgi:hypothetical protein